MKDTLTMVKKSAKCQFCDTFCKKGGKTATKSQWWNCKQCDVQYETSLKGKINLIHLKTKMKDNKFYVVRISFSEHESTIYAWEKFNGSYNAYEVVSFNHILDINPENLSEKLKTYLLFL